MRQNISWALVVLAFGFGFVSVANGQEGRPPGERPEANTRRTQAAEPESPAARGVPAQGNQAAAPRLVKVSGVLTEFVRNSVSSSVEMSFAVYKDEVGGEALWTETQSVEVDKEGRYTVLLGTAQADGVPVELFPAGEPRWLGVEIRGQAPQSRTLLVSVPYALKALDAEKLSGKSLSDFVLSESLGEQVRQVIQAQGQAAGQSTIAGAQPKQTGTSSTTTPQTSSPGPMFPPSTFSGTNSTQIVRVQQNGNGNGLVASTPSSTGGTALVGLATSTSTSNSVFQNGVYGQNDGSGAGVAGIATNSSVGVGVYGQSANFAGVFGNAPATSGFVTGVYGQSATGSGVAGKANASSGFTSGVSGDASASPNGTGVFGSAFQWVGIGGQATAPSGGPAYGVWGDSLSTDGTGVAGYEDATSGPTNGVLGVSISPSGNGMLGVNNAGNGGYGMRGIANATSGFANGVVGESHSPDGRGVIAQNFASNGGVGVFGVADATSGPANGVIGVSSSSAGNGVFGGNNAASGGIGLSGLANGTTGNAYGVYGATATTGFGAGVLGTAFATTGTAFGVFGGSSSPNGVAIFGHAASTSGYPAAVVGFLDSQQGGVAGQFVAHGGAGLILQGLSGSNLNQVFSVDANGNLNISGNLYVSGSKSSTVQLKSGREVALYAVESPENWFEDFGSAELKNGVAWVPLDPSFAETTNESISYHVFLTPSGDSNGLYVARKTAVGFEVREHAGGGSNVAFDYRIVVRRRGFEKIRMAEVSRDLKALESSHQRLAELANSGTLTKAPALRPAGITPGRIAPAPTVRPVPPRPTAPQLPRTNVPQAPKGSVPQPR